MSLSDEIKARIDVIDVLDIFQIKTQKKSKKYVFKAPWREEKTASVTISDDGKSFIDFGDRTKRGSCIDLYMLLSNTDFISTVKELAQRFNIQTDDYQKNISSKNEAKPAHTLDAAFIWRKAAKDKNILRATDYLVLQRGLPRDALQDYEGVAYGYSDYVPDNSELNPLEYGPAVVFPVIDVNGDVVALNQRYIETPDKKHPQGKRTIKSTGAVSLSECLYAPDWRGVKQASTLWMVESPIDALNLQLGGCPAIAFLSTSHASTVPLTWIKTKQSVCIWADNDANGRGKQAAEILYHRLLGLGIVARLVKPPKEDKDALVTVKKQVEEWAEGGGEEPQEPKPVHLKDVNDVFRAKKGDLKEFRRVARTINKDLFPFGFPRISNQQEIDDIKRFECHDDSVIYWSTRLRKNEDGEMEEVNVPNQVSAFRIFRIDPVTIYPLSSAMGDFNVEPPSEKMVLIYKRTDSQVLKRSILDSKDFGKSKCWEEFGIIHRKDLLAKMMTSLSRDHRFRAETVNIIGLVNMGGKLQLNDASNTYLNEDLSLFHDLHFPDTAPSHAKIVIDGMASMFTEYKALIVMIWILGSLLKVYTKFWPHLSCIASSQSGKSTLIDCLNYVTGTKSFEHTMLSSSYQQMRLVGNHAYACICDELSRATPKEVKEFISLLNSSYNSPLRARGMNRLYLLAGAVGIFGQDYSEKDAAIQSKIIAIDLDNSQGKLYEPTTRFPVRAWANWLISTQTKESIKSLIEYYHQFIINEISEEEGNKLGRFLINYAAMMAATDLILEFADVDDLADKKSSIVNTLLHNCKRHAIETKTIRSEAHAILLALASHMTNDAFEICPPHFVDDDQLYITTEGILTYLAKKNEHFAVGSAKGLIKHLTHDGFLIRADASKTMGSKKTGRKQFRHVLVLDLKRIEKAGINWPVFECYE